MLPLRLMGSTSLAARVTCLRYVSVIIASLIVPLVFLLARLVLVNEVEALGLATLITAMPELFIDISRVGNDSLSIPLYTLLVLLTLKFLQEPTRRRYVWAIGATLGCGLLTKEYFFTTVPVLALAFTWMRNKEGRSKIVVNAFLVGAIALTISGWWFLRSYHYTHMWLWQPGEDIARKVSISMLVSSAFRVNWWRVLADGYLTHVGSETGAFLGFTAGCTRVWDAARFWRQ